MATENRFVAVGGEYGAAGDSRVMEEKGGQSHAWQCSCRVSSHSEGRLQQEGAFTSKGCVKCRMMASSTSVVNC